MRRLLLIALVMSSPGLVLAGGPWRKSVGVHKVHRTTKKSKRVATIQNLRRQPKNNRVLMNHLPKSNGNTVFKNERGGYSTVVIQGRAGKDGKIRATVHEKDIAAIPVNTKGATYSVRGGSYIGITDPIGANKKGQRLLLFVPRKYSSSQFKVTVTDGKNAKPKRYEFAVDGASVTINHVLTPNGYRAQPPVVNH